MHDREVYLNKVTITLCQFIVIWFIFIMALHIKMNGEKYILPPFKKIGYVYSDSQIIKN